MDAQTEARAIALKIATGVMGNMDAHHVERFGTKVIATALAAKDAEREKAVTSANDLHNETIEELKRQLAVSDRLREAAEAQLAEANKALDEADFWLEGALTCKTWHWDADQREAATCSLERIRAREQGGAKGCATEGRQEARPRHCGGCGETDPNKRCIRCLADFGPTRPAEQAVTEARLAAAWVRIVGDKSGAHNAKIVTIDKDDLREALKAAMEAGR